MNPPLKFINLEKARITLAQYLVYGYLSEGDYIIPPFYQPKSFDGDTLLWLTPGLTAMWSSSPSYKAAARSLSRISGFNML